MNQKIHRLLYRSFEEPLDQTGGADLQAALHNSTAWQEKYHQVKALRRHLLQFSSYELRPLFSARVIRRLAAERDQELFYAALAQQHREELTAVLDTLRLELAPILSEEQRARLQQRR